MAKCPNPNCSSDNFKNLGSICACDDCGFTIRKKKKTPVILNFGIYLSTLIYLIPIVILFLFILVIIYFSISEVFTFDNFNLILDKSKLSKEFAEKMLIYFFIMLAVVDLSTLVLNHYVQPIIDTLYKNSELFDSDISNEFGNLLEKKDESKIYLEKLLIFGVIIILLDTFPKLFSSDNNTGTDILLILIGISTILISVGIWKHLSLNADLKLKTEFEKKGRKK